MRKVVPGICATFGSLLLLVATVRAQTPTVLHSFSYTDGSNPAVAMVLGHDGLLYGVTISGGANPCAGSQCGTVFKIDTAGNFTNIYDFPESGTDGFRPLAGLFAGSDGFFYGTTAVCGVKGSHGTVFQMDSSGTETILHTFTGLTEGAEPAGSVVRSADGTLFGTTANLGGADAHCVAGCGTLFSLDTGGTLTTMHSFNFSDGAIPQASLVFGADGYLYGTTPKGGNTNAACTGGATGCGTVFKSSVSGDFSTVYAFTAAGDGYQPGPTLVRASDGSLYGTTQLGGASFYGTVFKIDNAGVLTTLHSFVNTDGAIPYGGLVQATDGSFFGTTEGGGANGVGTIFKMDAAGNVTTLYSFDPVLGVNPMAPLVQASDGNLYGTASGGPTYGIVFRFPFQCYADVPTTNQFYADICIIGVRHITGGCGGGYYCPDSSVTRAQMAVFLLKAKHGASYAPPPCAGVFPDVSCPGQFTDWIEELAAEGITGGCGGGNYCPTNPVRRDQMSAFLLKAKNGSAYTPPACAGIFSDVPCPGLFADWIEELSALGITGGCGGGKYCPGNPNTRGQMAVFLVRTFGLL